jgi:hypothetical protein
VEGLTWGVLGVAVCGLVSFGLLLIFLWKVYRAGGREDMKAAAEALREARRRDLGMSRGRDEPRAQPDSEITGGGPSVADPHLLPPGDSGG